MTPSIIVAVIVLLLGAALLYRSRRRVPQETVDIVERLGRYHRTLGPGQISMTVPLIERIRARVDLRTQVVHFPPQPITLSDGVVAKIDWVIHFEVIDAKAAVYEVSNYLHALEQLGATALRAVGGDMDLERISAARPELNNKLRETLDENANNWGIRVRLVELKAIEPQAA